MFLHQGHHALSYRVRTNRRDAGKRADGHRHRPEHAHGETHRGRECRFVRGGRQIHNSLGECGLGASKRLRTEPYTALQSHRGHISELRMDRFGGTGDRAPLHGRRTDGTDQIRTIQPPRIRLCSERDRPFENKRHGPETRSGFPQHIFASDKRHNGFPQRRQGHGQLRQRQ